MFAVDMGVDSNLTTSSVGLLAARVASAAARRRLGQELSDLDLIAVRSVITDLDNEVKVLRGQQNPNVDDESAYAFAGFALGALHSWGSVSSKMQNEDAATSLSALVGKLTQLVDGTLSQPEEIETLFLSASRNASSDSGGTGERLEGIPASFGPR